MYRQTGPSKGNRRPTAPVPGSKGPTRPTRQRGGGGNKAAGSAEPTAATSTVATVSPGGVVTGISPAATHAAEASKRRATRAKRQADRKERRVRAAVLAQVAADRRSRAKGRMASTAKISSRDSSKPAEFRGRKTAGTPTVSELRQASKAGALGVNKAGYVTTPAVRQASKRLGRAQKAARRSAPDLLGLSPAERRAAKLDVKIGPKFGIPPSVLMSQQRQESGFDPAAVSSADAQGISQFIPSTAESYGVEFGTGQKEVRSQIRGQAKLLRDSGFATDPKGALSAYTGGYSDAEYNDPVLQGAADYEGLDRKGSPKAQKRLTAAAKAAKAVGLKPKAATGTRVGPAPQKLVKRTVVAEHAMREIEGEPYVWGGGHGTFGVGGGKDCSGAVSYVLHKVMPGRMKAPLTSGAMGSVLDPGPGALTVFYNPDHTFLRLINRRGEAEYWGTSVGDSGAGGLTRHPTPSKAYLAQYSVGHVPGMGKLQALQLGADPAAVSGTGSYAGMEFSGSGGTTATITPGAAVVKSGKPGRSKRPIQLTPTQRFNRAKRKLASIGAPLSSSSSRSGRSESHPILDELKAKYGSAPTATKS